MAQVIGARLAALEAKRLAGTLTADEDAELGMHAVAVRFVEYLQMKARAILRRPANHDQREPRFRAP